MQNRGLAGATASIAKMVVLIRVVGWLVLAGSRDLTGGDQLEIS